MNHWLKKDRCEVCGCAATHLVLDIEEITDGTCCWRTFVPHSEHKLCAAHNRPYRIVSNTEGK